MKKLRYFIGIMGVAAVFFAAAPDAKALTYYMTQMGGQDATQARDGTSWQRAFSEAQYEYACDLLLQSPDPEKILCVAVGQYDVGVGNVSFPMYSGITVLGAWNPNSGNRLVSLEDDEISYVPMTQIIGAACNNGQVHDNAARIPTDAPPAMLVAYQDFQLDDIAVVHHFEATPEESILDGFSIWQLPGGANSQDDIGGLSEADLHCAILHENGKLRNVICQDGRAGFGGGVCLINGGTVESSIVQNCRGTSRFTHMRGTPAQHTDVFPGYGGGVFVYGRGTLDSVVIRNCEVTNGSGQHGSHEGPLARGGGFYVSNPGVAPLANPALIRGCHITECTSEASGGGTYCDQMFIIENTTFSKNATTAWGGGMVLTIPRRDEGIQMTDCTFEENTAIWGGGLYMGSVGQNFKIFNTTFRANLADGGGGGACIFDGYPDSCTFIDNAAAYGGGVSLYENGRVYNCYFTGNYTQASGAYPVSFPGTAAEYMYPPYCAGGAIYSDGTATYASGCTAEANDAERGGGFFGWFGGTLQSCTFRNNTADYGAGIGTYLGGFYYNCTIADNEARSNGGGLYGGDGINLHGSTVANNSAQGDGGGIWATLDTAHISSSLIINNTSAGNGGGIYFNGGGSITNCTVANNRTQGSGGGIYAMDAQLYNNIIWNNMSSGTDAEYFLGGDRGSMDYNAIFDVENTSTQINLNLDNLDGNGPRFRYPNPTVGLDPNWENYTWDLYDSSICINAGDNDLIPTLQFGVDDDHLYRDILQSPRIVAQRVDMGAYESQTMETTIYVWKRAIGDKSGYTWRNAVETIAEAQQKIRDELNGAGKICVAGGTGDDFVYSAAPYILLPSMEVVGGWDPESLTYAPMTYPSVLDGTETAQILIQMRDFIDSEAAAWRGFHFTRGYGVDTAGSYAYGAGATVRVGGTVSESVFHNNIGTIGGGAAYLSGGTLDSCIIRDNRLIEAGAPTSYGGGIYVDHSAATSTISACEIMNNNAEVNGFGGGIYVAINADIIKTNLQGNFAGKSGGGLYCEANTLFTNSKVTGNRANESGGGVWFGQGSVIGHHLEISGNAVDSTYGVGGGATLVFGTLHTSKIGNNVAYDGGGVWLDSGMLGNSLVANNEATHLGGGYYVQENAGVVNSLPAVVNCTVVNNASPDRYGYDSLTSPGAFIGGCYTTNNLYWGNNNNFTKQYCDLKGNDQFPTLDRCASFMLTDAQSGIYYLADDNDDDEGPNFYTPSQVVGLDDNWLAYDWRIKDISICVNNGMLGAVNSYPTDLAGGTRIIAMMPDIGAYEAQNAKVIRYVDVSLCGTGDAYSWRNAGSAENLATYIGEVSRSPTGGEIRFRSGDYIFNSPISPRTNVHLYGGFSGSGEDRDGYSMITTGGMSRVLQQEVAIDSRTIVDGFWFYGGNAGAYPEGGGGVYLKQNMVLQNCIVSECEAAVRGGGVSVEGTELYNVVIANNTVAPSSAADLSTDYGIAGGLYAKDTAIVAGCLIVNNEAPFIGGARIEGNSCFVNGTVVNNFSSESYAALCGSALDVHADNNAQCTNNILWQNKHFYGTPATGGQLKTVGMVNSGYNAIQGTPTAWVNLADENTSTTNLGPRFIRPSSVIGNDPEPYSVTRYDWRLAPMSICVDNANNGYAQQFGDAYSTDLDKAARVFNKAVDLGAYERVYTQLTLIYGTIAPSGASSGKYYEGDVVDIRANDRANYTFINWAGDVSTVANPYAKATTVTIPASHVTITANYTNSQGSVVNNGAPVTVYYPGSAVVGSSTSKVNSSAGGAFSKAPKIYALTKNGKKYPFVLADRFTPGAASVDAVYNGKFPLYTKKALKAHYKAGGSVRTFAEATGENTATTVDVYAKIAGYAKDLLIYEDVRLAPAFAFWTDDWNVVASEDVANATIPANFDGNYGKVNPGKSFYVEGSGFGSKIKSAWIEYKDPATGAMQKINLKVGAKTSLDVRGKKSYTGEPLMPTTEYLTRFGDKPELDSDFGIRLDLDLNLECNSLVELTIPKKVVYKKLPLASGTYTVVIDNGTSLSYFSIYLKND